MQTIKNIHHVTSIVGDTQENYDFYTQVLGMKLIKQTVNFDDQNTYHFYFSNEALTPGYVMTTFPWDGARPGKKGCGQGGRIAFRIPKGRMDDWRQHLDDQGISHERTELFQKETLEFSDPHDLPLALVEGDQEADDKAIVQIHGIEMWSAHPEASRDYLVDKMGLKQVGEDDQAFHLETAGEIPNHIIVPKEAKERGEFGPGTTHHVAWQQEDMDQLLASQKELQDENRRPTDVRDRKYFRSVYFLEPGFVRYELATNGPGFLVDEDPEDLGQTLMLPDQYEDQRQEIEATLADFDQ